MVEVLSEIKGLPYGPRIIEPIVKVFKKKPEMLEEQIRDLLPCDIESEEEKNEEL